MAVGVKVTGNGTPTGSVTVTAKLSSTTVTCTATLSSGAGSCSVTLSTVGTWTLTAAYGGDGNFNTSSTSAGTSQTVNAAPLTLKISPTSVSFGNVYLNQTAYQNVTLTNMSSSSITISSVTIPGSGNDGGSQPGDPDDFGADNDCPNTLGAGKSCTIKVSFGADNDDYSLQYATLTIKDNATGSPQTVPLSATVINPQAYLSPGNLNFGNQKTGTTSAAKKVTLTNFGTTPLILSGLTISGNFAIVPGGCTSSTTLAPGKNCTISVTFTPTSKGSKSGSVTITDNAQNSPQYISLSGNGD